MIESNSYQPIVFRITDSEQKQNLLTLQHSASPLTHDTIHSQLKELIKLRNPFRKLSDDEYETEIKQMLNQARLTAEEYGVWVYYPWSNTLVHTLDETEFIEVRTSRNQYKITKSERDILQTKKIGIIGLSVGQSIALTIAIERICGELVLADFDTLELSNLNRLRSGIQNLGLPKVIITAREIAEIDPFIKVSIYDDGITLQNIDRFFGKDSKPLDLLVEVCDGLDIKIISRDKARKLKIPVVMDTNDRGMIDIERFDLEPDRPILHGLAGDLTPDNIQDLTNEQKIPHILKMVGAEQISTRLKASMMEVGETLNTWPQLASSVQLGGAATTDVSRRILLNQLHVSGRFYIDLDTLISDTVYPASSEKIYTNPFAPLDEKIVTDIAEAYLFAYKTDTNISIPSNEEINLILDAAIVAPSVGNNQPWKWFYSAGRLLLLHDRFRSWSWSDYAEMGALMSLGTAIESVKLQSAALNLYAQVKYIANNSDSRLIAEINFEKAATKADSSELKLASGLFTRQTNRTAGSGIQIAPKIIDDIRKEIESNHSSFQYIDDKKVLAEIGELVGSCDRINLLNEHGHYDFFQTIRWTEEDALQYKDGMTLKAMGLPDSFAMMKDYTAIKYLNEWDLGKSFKKLAQKNIESASGFGIVSIPEFTKQNLLQVGNNIMRAWITANQQQVSIYPMLSIPFFLNRLQHGNGIDIPEKYKWELQSLTARFNQINSNNGIPVFAFRLTDSKGLSAKSNRKEKKDIVYVKN